MEHQFWHERWNENKIAFHQSETHPLLVKYLDRLGLTSAQRVFVPLCGKTLDMAYLLSRGYRVVGAELVESAVQQFFAELEVEPAIEAIGKLKRYSAPNVDIFVGDIFELSRALLGDVHAVYDRAALVALPADLRRRYTRHLTDITGTAPQFLITFEYDQSKMDGPPFSIPHAEVREHYAADYEVALIESTDLAGGLKGLVAAKEDVWLLKK